jgi:PadR family transcriptional regulator
MDATLEELVLESLLEGPAHGYGIAERIGKVDASVLESDEGAIYPVLYRLMDDGWITATRQGSDSGDSPRVYLLTERGRSRLRQANP